MTPFHTALSELQSVTDQLDMEALERACELISQASRIVGYGCGREGLQIAGLVMRLHHLGLRAAMQGDMSAPPLGMGDLFICSACQGDLATVTALMKVAHAAGADILYFTSQPQGEAAGLANLVLTIPARPMVAEKPGTSVLPMGSVYQGAMFLLFEVMVLDLRERLSVTADTMRARHTNME